MSSTTTTDTLPTQQHVRRLVEDLADRWAFPQQARRDSWPDPEMVSRTSFARLVTLHLRLSGFEPDERDLDAYVRSVWPAILEDQRPEVWAGRYLEAVRGGRDGS